MDEALPKKTPHIWQYWKFREPESHFIFFFRSRVKKCRKNPLTRLSIPSDNHMDIEDSDHTSPTKRQRAANAHVTPNRYPITAAAVGSRRTRETDQWSTSGIKTNSPASDTSWHLTTPTGTCRTDYWPGAKLQWRRPYCEWVFFRGMLWMSSFVGSDYCHISRHSIWVFHGNCSNLGHLQGWWHYSSRRKLFLSIRLSRARLHSYQRYLYIRYTAW